MKLFAGFDIGTTNTKMLVASDDGMILSSRSTETPICNHGGARFFDIEKLDRILDLMLDEARGLGELEAVCYSSVGESVVPVGHGAEALYDAPMWNEFSICASSEEKDIIGKKSAFAQMGTRQNGLLSVEKILWLRKHCNLGNARLFLPICSYEAWRKTGQAIWDYSEGARSGMNDFGSRSWNLELLGSLSLSECGRFASIGTLCGCDNSGVAYAVGGHDHITGLYAISKLMAGELGKGQDQGAEGLLYNSMGTSAVLVCLSDREIIPIRHEKGAFQHGFDGRLKSIATRSFRSFGSLFSMWSSICGIDFSSDGFRAIQSEIAMSNLVEPSFKLSCNGDFFDSEQSGVAGKAIAPSCIKSYIQSYIKDGLSPAEALRSLYLYLATLLGVMEADLMASFDLEDYRLPYYAGGGVCNDRLFMDYLATAINHEVHVLDTKEITALGAVCSAMNAAGRGDALRSLAERQTPHVICPSDGLRPQTTAAHGFYLS